MDNFPKYAEKSPFIFCIFTIYHPLFYGISKAPFWDAKCKNRPTFIQFSLSKGKKLV